MMTNEVLWRGLSVYQNTNYNGTDHRIRLFDGLIKTLDGELMLCVNMVLVVKDKGEPTNESLPSNGCCR